MKRIIGVTGPTGAGKGMAARILGKLLKADIIDADFVVRQMYAGGELPKVIGKEFGNQCITPDGGVDRKKLGSIVFSDTSLLQKLNDTVLPIVAKELQRLIDELGDIVILDAPTLIESGLDKICTETLAVLANKETRLQRIMERDNISQTDAMRRIEAQHDDGFYSSACSNMITNDTDLSELEAKLRTLFMKGEYPV